MRMACVVGRGVSTREQARAAPPSQGQEGEKRLATQAAQHVSAAAAQRQREEQLCRDAAEAAQAAKDSAEEAARRHKQELRAMEAAYERKLAAQVEAYNTLSEAFEELAAAAAATAAEERSRSNVTLAEFEESKQAEVTRLLEEEHTLRDYVAFLRRQYEAALAAEEKLREREREGAAAAVAGVRAEAAAMVERAKEQTIIARKELRTAAKRLDEQGAREAKLRENAEEALAQVDVQCQRVAALEAEVDGHRKRLTEWEVIADKQRGASRDLVKLRQALTGQLQEQRAQLERRDAQLACLQERLRGSDALQEKCLEQVQALDERARKSAAALCGMRERLAAADAAAARQRNAAAAAARDALAALAGGIDRKSFVPARAAAEAALQPLLHLRAHQHVPVPATAAAADGDDGNEDAAGAAEIERQRARMHKALAQAGVALRRGRTEAAHADARHLDRAAALNAELNELRRDKAALAKQVQRLRVAQAAPPIQRRPASGAGGSRGALSPPVSATASGARSPTSSMLPPASPYDALLKSTGSLAPQQRPATTGSSRSSGGGGGGGGARVSTPVVLSRGGELSRAAAAAKVSAAEERAAAAEGRADALLRERAHAAAQLQALEADARGARSLATQLQRELQHRAALAALGQDGMSVTSSVWDGGRSYASSSSPMPAL